MSGDFGQLAQTYVLKQRLIHVFDRGGIYDAAKRFG